MAAINTTEFVLSAARDAYSTLRRAAGQRPQAVAAFLDATTDEERDLAIEAWGAGFVRRGLREAAVYFDGKNDGTPEGEEMAEIANAFWTLRDSINDDGFLNAEDAGVEDEAELVNA